MRATGAALAAIALAMATGGAARVGAAAEHAVRAPADSLADLPLHAVAARGTASRRLAILLTGDGGWASIDKELADTLAAHGTAVVALDSRSYFRTQRSPDGAARDLERIARHYMAQSGDDALVLIGYSRGADVLPFLASRLTPDVSRRVTLVALLAPAPNANFKFHLVDLVSNKHRADDLMTVPEIAKLAGVRVLCFYGADEKESACPALDSTKVTVVKMPGGHHLGKAYGQIAMRIVEAAGR